MTLTSLDVSRKNFNDAKAVDKLINDIAPSHVERRGGYTRVYSLGKRVSDTASISRLEWV
ncbi:hypothetical protein HOD08_03020 [bacterium]|nr:hypothetical protein [bacterium]